MTTEPSTKRAPGRPRNLPVEEQREKILVAARHVFAEHDFHGTTIDRVAREAGVTRPAVYEMFGGKDELFIAVADDAVLRLIDGIRKRLHLDAIDSPRDLVRADVAALFDFMEHEPDVAVIIRIVEYGGVGPAKSEVVTGRHRIEQLIANAFSDGWGPIGGITVEAARLLALISLAMVEAVGFRQPLEPKWEVDATIDFITDFIVGGMARLTHGPNQLATFGIE